MEITPSRKRFTVTMLGETFKTQKSLIERVKPMLHEYEILKAKNQEFIKALLSTYDKVLERNKPVRNVIYAWKARPFRYYKNTQCLHAVFEDRSQMSVSYKNVVSACFDPDGTALRNESNHKNQQYRLAVAEDIRQFRCANIQLGCAECNVSFLENWGGPMSHVDHCGEKEFRHLVADFEAQTDEPDFAKYHEARAELQMLCENCNLKKSRRP